MKWIFARIAVLSAAFCVSGAALAQDRFAFWASGGEHGIDACVFTTLPTGEHIERLGQLNVGIRADPKTLELVGKVRLRLDGMPSAPSLLEIGGGGQPLLRVKLRAKSARTATGDVPAEAMKVLLRTFIRQPASWVRFDGTTEWAVITTGKEQEVASCLAVLERDLAEERGARSRGEITTSFPVLQDDD